MTVNLSALAGAGQQFFSDAGIPLSGGKLYSYVAGTTTPQATYTSINGATPHANPIILNSAGRVATGEIWVTAGSSYKFILKTSTDVTIATWDNIVAIPPTAAEIPFTGFNGQIGYVQDLADNDGSDWIGFQQTGAGAVAISAQNKMRETLSAFDFMTAAQIASVQAYNYAVDVTVAMQNAINQAEVSGQTLVLPPGGYLLSSTLAVPTNSTNKRFRVIKIVGAGTGNPFAITNAGTVLKNFNDQTILSYLASGISINAEDEFDISGIVFWSANATNPLPVVYIAGFYGIGQFHHNNIRQNGIGNGLEVGYAAGISIHDNYFMNRDLLTFGLGASRVGIGLYISQSYGAGLIEIRKNSSRGWLTAYKLGQDTLVGKLYKTLMEANECSVTYDGIIVTVNCESTTITNNYFEGADQGVAITDNGNYTFVSNNFSFAGYSIHINSGANTVGGMYVGNSMSLSQPGGTSAIGVKLNDTGAYASLNRICTGNFFTFGGSSFGIAGVVGIEISGVNPKLDLSSNVFSPINWSGGAGTAKISDLSTNTTGSGSGVYGFGVALDSTNEFPYLGRGSYGVGLSSTTLTQANVVANVLTVTAASDFVMTATVATTVNSITAPNIENKLFWIRSTNVNTTFANTATLKLSGSVNFTPGAAGASLCFKCHSGIVYEVARTAY